MRGCRERAGVFASLVIASLVVTAACGSKSGLPIDVTSTDSAVAPDSAVRDPICVEVTHEQPRATASLDVPVSLAVVDVFFAIDATASMVDEIDTIRRRLVSTVVPNVRALIPDAAFGAAFIGEFPVEPYGPPGVVPFELESPVTTDPLRVEAALVDVPRWGNFDDPEAQVEGLYQIATGEGFPPFVPPSLGCASGGSGAACFRPDALPVVLLITDAPMHQGPAGEHPYDFTPAPHAYDDAVTALRAADVFVIGLGARDPGTPSPMPHLRRIAEDTGARAQDGRPLAFDVGATGEGVDDGVVTAIATLAASVPLDVDAVVEDVPGDATDATRLVRAVIPRRAEPAGGVRGIDGTSFVGVVPGTRVSFELVVDGSAWTGARDVIVPARVLFRAFRRSRLGVVDVAIVLRDRGPGCDDFVAEER